MESDKHNLLGTDNNRLESGTVDSSNVLLLACESPDMNLTEGKTATFISTEVL